MSGSTIPCEGCGAATYADGCRLCPACITDLNAAIDERRDAERHGADRGKDGSMKFRTTLEIEVMVECEVDSNGTTCEWVEARTLSGAKVDLTGADVYAIMEEAVAEERMRRVIAEESDADWRAECRTRGP